MAHLLGGESCLGSLARDISDVQGTILDIMMKVGPVRIPSWKYPDKVSCDLDINELLERYCFSEDKDHARMSHIILFELLIDRFVLVQQCLSRFCDGVLQACLGDDRPKTGKSVGSSISVGLVVKKYWNKMVQVQQAVQKMQVETKEKTRNVKQMEDTIKDLREEIQTYLAVLEQGSGGSSVISGKIRGTHGGTKSSAKFTLSKSEGVSLRSPLPSPDLTLSVEDVAFARTCEDKASQTYETAFVPCEACSRTQQNLIDVGNMVMSLCKSQGLPSSLAKQKKLLKQSLLAAADVSRWTAEQNRDLARINGHLDNLYAQINPLQEKLLQAQENCKTMEKNMQQLEGEKTETETRFSQKEEEYKMQISGVIAMKEKAVKALEKTNTDLDQKKNELEEVVSSQNVELNAQKERLQNLEQEQGRLSEELVMKTQEVERLAEAEQELTKVKVDLEALQTDLKRTVVELGKVQAKNRSLEKHDKALQSKHDALLSRVDELDQECEELKDRVLEADEDKEEALESLKTVKESNDDLESRIQAKQKILDEIAMEKDGLLRQVEELQEDVNKLQEDLKQAEDNLRLVTDYPCIEEQDGRTQGPSKKSVGTQDSPDTEEVNVTDEMGKQISANNIRILLLEEQNESLRRSISKIAEQFGNHGARRMDGPIPLWNQDVIINSSKPSSRIGSAKSQNRSLSQEKHREVQRMYKQDNRDFIDDSQIRPAPPAEPKSDPVKPRRRTPSAKLLEKRESSALSAKLATSSKMVSSMFTTSATPMVDPPVSRQPSKDQSYMFGWNDDDTLASTQRYSPVNVFVCQGCDKMYTSQKDLDIHKSFCYGSR